MKKEQRVKGVGKHENDPEWILEEEEETTATILLPVKDSGCRRLATPVPPRRGNSH